jgi:hypothetical protein
MPCCLAARLMPLPAPSFLARLLAGLLCPRFLFGVFRHQIEGKQFKPLGRPDSRQAVELLEKGRKRFEKQQREQ